MDVVHRTDPPKTLTLGGVSRRVARRTTLLLLAGGLVVGGTTAWLANVEPITVDGGAISVVPRSLVANSVDATSPDGDVFTQYTVPLHQGQSFKVLFWLHNTAPFPVTLTDAGEHQTTGGPETVGVRVGPASGAEAPSAAPPYTIPAHGYAAIQVEERLVGCIEARSFTTLSTLPVSFRLFGSLSRRTTVTMPMTIQITGPDGTTCRG